MPATNEPATNDNGVSLSPAVLVSATVPALLVLALTLGMCTSTCFAQVRRYQPSRPTTSSYLNLTRLNTGAIPNYYSLVRPAQRQRAFNLQEQALRSQQAGSLQQLQNRVQLGLQPAQGTGKQSGFFRPSSRATFNTSTRYFQTNTVTNTTLGRR